MDFRKEFGRRVKQRREALRLTQAEVSEKCDAAVSTVQRIEAGALWPVADLFVTLHRALELPLGVLATNADVAIRPTPEQAIEVLADLVKSRHT